MKSWSRWTGEKGRDRLQPLSCSLGTLHSCHWPGSASRLAMNHTHLHDLLVTVMATRVKLVGLRVFRPNSARLQGSFCSWALSCVQMKKWWLPKYHRSPLGLWGPKKCLCWCKLSHLFRLQSYADPTPVVSAVSQLDKTPPHKILGDTTHHIIANKSMEIWST